MTGGNREISLPAVDGRGRDPSAGGVYRHLD
jgi:hypothetical protein